MFDKQTLQLTNTAMIDTNTVINTKQDSIYAQLRIVARIQFHTDKLDTVIIHNKEIYYKIERETPAKTAYKF